MPRRPVELTKCFITGELMTQDITAAIYEYTGDSRGLAAQAPSTQALCVVLWLARPLRGPRGLI
jgi:hypothetical protein